MKRLTYNKETHNTLLNMAEGEQCYWRYQDAEHGGTIPVGHQSHERIFEGESPEYIEEGCSCYDNPWQLLQYLSDELHPVDKVDVVLFLGKHIGYGLDEEDIVKVREESDILYSITLRDFYKFAFNLQDDIYWNTYDVKERFINPYGEKFKQGIFSNKEMYYEKYI